MVVDLPDLHLGADTVICSDDQLELQATTGLARYLWSTGATQSKITTGPDTLYWVEGESHYGCLSRDTITVSRKDCSLGQYDQRKAEPKWKLLPNPASSAIHIEAPESWVGELRVLDLQGQVVFQLATSFNPSTEIWVEDWEPGWYTLAVYYNGGNHIYRFIVR